VLQVVCSVSLGEGVVPCDVQFDPLSKQYLLLLCRNGSMALYGISEEQHALGQVRPGCQLCWQPHQLETAAAVAAGTSICWYCTEPHEKKQL
jgi:hypothetical protein